MTERLEDVMRDARTLAYAVLASVADALNTGASLIGSKTTSSHAPRPCLPMPRRTRCSLRLENASALAAIERNVAELAQLQSQLAAEFGDA